jgi:hypothetical protein
LTLSFLTTHPSIERFLRQQLSAAVMDEMPPLPIYRSILANGIRYRCPLQYYFSAGQRVAMVNYCRSFAHITLTPEGWLEWCLDERDLSSWLQHLWHSIEVFFPYQSPRDSNPDFSFLLQYTHARCCALGRLGARVGITIEGNEAISCAHPVERALLLQLLTVVDRWDTANPQTLAVNFCQSILDFDRGCRIVGEPIPVARWHLMAIAVSQQLLRALLASKLDLLPLEEL